MNKKISNSGINSKKGINFIILHKKENLFNGIIVLNEKNVK